MKLIELKEKLPCTYEAIAHMFEIVWVNKKEYDNIDVSEQDWFMRYEWTDKQQDEFADWLYRKLYNNKECREEIMQFPIRKKHIIDKVVWMFILNYWLKLKWEQE